MRVLKDDGTEVELKENLDDTDMNLHRLLEGDRRYRDNDRERFGSYGYTKQEFNEAGDLENIEEDVSEEDEEGGLFEETSVYEAEDGSDAFDADTEE